MAVKIKGEYGRYVGKAKRKRNPEAVCSTCEYFEKQYPDDREGQCRIRSNSQTHSYDFWCGEHPDFWTQTDDGIYCDDYGNCVECPAINDHKLCTAIPRRDSK